MTPTQIAYSFVDAINTGDPDRIAELMTHDHTFIDADGSEHTGREHMRRGWGEYYAMVPDFQIHVIETYASDNTVALFGTAEGTFAEDGELKAHNHWHVPTAWRVVVEDHRVAVWQLYVNPEPMREILDRINEKGP
jgi:uncharacterized protein (TIGR02246 family)